MEIFRYKNEEIVFTHDVYKAFIHDDSNKKKIIPTLINNIPCTTFSKPVTSRILSKVYIIKNHKNTIVYVGKTRQSIATRFRQGLNPISGSGYYGYKWQDKEVLFIHCITIKSFNDTEIESTEAEVVYCHRTETGKWPSFQSEIHFSNNDKCRLLAQYIYSLVAK